MGDPSEPAPEAESQPLEERVAELAGEVAGLRRDVARLWLAYGRHERRLGDVDPDAGGAASGDPESIGGQLADLDDVLEAIERATEALESAQGDTSARTGDERSG